MAILSRPEEQAGRGAAGAAGDGEDLRAAGAALEGGEDRGEAVGAVDEREPSAGPEPAEAGVDPVGDRRLALAVGAVAARVGGGGGGTGVEGRVHQDVVEAHAAQRGGRLAKVALVDGEREAVRRGVAAGEIGIGGLEFQAVEVEARDPGGEAERRGAGAAGRVRAPLAGAGGDEGGEQDRVGGGAVAGAAAGAGGGARRGSRRG